MMLRGKTTANLSFSNLRLRLLLLWLLAIVPAFGLIVFSASEEHREQTLEVQGDAFRLVQLAARDWELLVRQTHQTLQTLARSVKTHSENPSACNTYLEDLLREQPLLANIGLVGSDGNLACSAIPPTQSADVSEQAWFRRAVQSGNFTMGDYQIGRVTGKSLLLFGYPILNDSGEVQSVAFAAVDLAGLGEFAERSALPENSILTVYDGNGHILAHYPNPESWVGQLLPEAPIVKTMQTMGKGTSEAQGIDGIRRLYAFTKQDVGTDTSIYLSIGIPPDTAYAKVQQKLLRNLLGLGLTGMLALGGVWLFGSFFLLRPSNALLVAANRLRGGDLTARTQLATKQGELGQLAVAFDEMATALQERHSEAERAEEALREANALMENTFANLSEAVFVSDLTTRAFVSCNPAAERIFGYSRNEILGRTPEFLHVNPEMCERFQNQSIPVLTAGQVFRIEYMLRRKDGSVFPTEHTMSTIRDASGRTTCVINVIRDITERRQAEIAIRQQAERLEALHEMDKAVLAAQSPVAIAEAALHHIGKLMPCRQASVVLFDRTGRKTTTVAEHSCDDNEAQAGLPVGVTLTVGPSGILQDSGRETQPFATPSDPVQLIRGLRTEEGCYYVNVPLTSRGELLGYLNLGSDLATPFGGEHMDIIGEIAASLAIALQQSRLLEQLVSETERLHALSQRLAEVQEVERRNIARELHDEIGQLLTGLQLRLATASRQSTSGAKTAIDAAQALTVELIAQVRELSLNLRPTVLDDLGLLPALLWHRDRFVAQTQLEVNLLHHGLEGRRLGPQVETAAYRIIQEALTNVARHAQANRVSIRLSVDGERLLLQVADDGSGFDSDGALTSRSSCGLVGMHERCLLLGGRLTIDSSPRKGTIITAELPLPALRGRNEP